MSLIKLTPIARRVLSESDFDDKVVKTLTWDDGVKLELNIVSNPVGYKYLGWANDAGFKLPKSDDWREFYSTTRGHSKTFSPKLKVWYETDSSD